MILSDEYDVFAQLVGRQVGNWRTADGHCPGVRAVEAGEETRERGLPCSGGANDGQPLSGLHEQIDSVNTSRPSV